jgi:hypothetical protein
MENTYNNGFSSLPERCNISGAKKSINVSEESTASVFSVQQSQKTLIFIHAAVRISCKFRAILFYLKKIHSIISIRYVLTVYL